jgi:hypothetical protein
VKVNVMINTYRFPLIYSMLHNMYICRWTIFNTTSPPKVGKLLFLFKIIRIFIEFSNCYVL